MATAEVASQLGGRERVEVVAARQEHGVCDLLELGLPV
jgi:hypothetical protein